MYVVAILMGTIRESLLFIIFKIEFFFLFDSSNK